MTDGKIEVEIQAVMNSSSLDKAAKQTQKRMEKIGLKDLPLPAPLKKFAESIEKGLAAFRGPGNPGKDGSDGFRKIMTNSQANNSVMITHLAAIRKGVDRLGYIMQRDTIKGEFKQANVPGVLSINPDKAMAQLDKKFGMADLYGGLSPDAKNGDDNKKLGLKEMLEPIKHAGMLFKDSVKSKGVISTVAQAGKGVMGQGEGAGGAGIASMIGPLAGLMIIGQGIFGIISAIFGMVMQSSPALQHVIKILNRGFNYILRPMGDILAMLLQPIAQFFKIFGKKFMAQQRARKKELKAQGIKGPEAAAILAAEAPGMLFDTFIDTLMKSLEGIDWGKAIMDALVAAFNFSGIGLILNALAPLGEWVWNELTKALGPIGEKLMAIPNWIWGRITALFQVKNLGDFGKWLWTTITQALGGAFNFLKGLGSWLWNTFTGIFTGFSNLLGGIPKQIANFIIGGINGIIRTVKNLGFDFLGQRIAPFGWLKEVPTLDTGGIAKGPVTANLAMNGKPEMIAPLSQLPNLFGGMGGGGSATPSINVNISGNVYGVNDLKSAIKSGVDDYYRTTGRSR